ncbi:Efflux ABC transporter, permease/ATP-binding protein MdlA [Olavius algarvensis Delta 1 endosymbiont]|nr:Efflux ABC transporter, permease/ATP-binding protein MdlA [Olavius algarvensis Delta 1 endosymbiont]
MTSLIKPYFIENRAKIIAGLLSLIVVDVLQLIIPRIFKWVVDDLTAFRIDTARLLSYALLMVGIAVLVGIFRYIWRRCLLGTSRRVEEGLRNTLFNHLQTLSASYFDDVKTGDLMAHATNDIQQIRMATGMGMVAINDAIVLGLAAIGFMAYINIKLTAFVLIPMPLIVVSTRFFSKRMHRGYQAVQAAFSELTEVIRERFVGVRIIKAHHRRAEESRRVETVSREYIHQNISLVKIIGTFFPMMLLFTNLSLAIVLYLGGRQTILQTITPGDFVAFISYLGLLTWPMMALGWVTNLIQRGRASLDRINKILQTVPAIRDGHDARDLESAEGHIVFENVFFSYASNGNSAGAAALSNINLSIGPGQVLGIVGPPGCGKSTLIGLIPRLYEQQHGKILLDGNDIRSLKINDLRSHIAYIPQEPFLFAGTIRDNITFGNSDIPEQRLEKAVRDAVLHETIQSFPDGFETVVGEKGIILSGGQKQRLALARCLLKDSGILILDDPISQVDLETGTAIINTIRQTAGAKTIVIASHRLSALSYADWIIALDQGHVVESGTHRQLMTADNYYAQTYRLQEIEEELDAA